MSAQFYKNGSLWFIHPDTALSLKSVVILFFPYGKAIKHIQLKIIDTLTRYYHELSDILNDFSEFL